MDRKQDRGRIVVALELVVNQTALVDIHAPTGSQSSQTYLMMGGRKMTWAREIGGRRVAARLVSRREG